MSKRIAVASVVVRWALPFVVAVSGCTEAPQEEATEPTVAAAPAEEPASPAQASGSGKRFKSTQTVTPSEGESFHALSWTAVSQDGTAVLMQTHLGGGKCRRTCNDGEGGQEVWSADGCIARQIDLRFVSNDCEKVAVLHQLPEVRRGERWQQVPVAHVYARARLEYPVAAAGAVRDFKKIKSAGTTFYWLQGALGQPGPAPRYADDGSAVEFVTADGNAQRIPLTAPK